MGKTKQYCYAICLIISIAINILFSINLYIGRGWLLEKKLENSCHSVLSWTEKAAAEAEAVAAISCSGHGRAYVDGLTYEGQPVCECFDCYGGTDCSELSPGCSADADSFKFQKHTHMSLTSQSTTSLITTSQTIAQLRSGPNRGRRSDQRRRFCRRCSA